MVDHTAQNYTLHSDDAIDAPGLLNFCVAVRADANNPQNHSVASQIIRQAFDLSERVATGLVEGTIPYTTKDGNVHFTVRKDVLVLSEG